MKISYAITVCNEFVEIQKLLSFLLKNKRKEDEVVVLYDKENGNKEVEAFLRARSIDSSFIWQSGNFKNHFADWKNKLSKYCSGDYIFQIDADEMPHMFLLSTLPLILEQNNDLEVFLVPRVNTVEGLTKEHIQKWGWNVDSKNRANWPDHQWRIWKNIPGIKWVNKVHEKLDGFKTYSSLPDDEKYALYHEKDIVRQEIQNNYYSTL